MTPAFELGLYASSVDWRRASSTDTVPEPGKDIHHLLEAIELADQTGLDLFAIGDEQRPASPAILLGAAAARTSKIRLSMLLGNRSLDDYLRVPQRVSTLDLLSTGRAEIMVDAEASLQLDADNDVSQTATSITLANALRAAVHDPSLDLRPVQLELPVWVRLNATSQWVSLAASHGLPMALPLTGHLPERLAPYFHLYREVARQHSFTAGTIPLSVIGSGMIADQTQAAIDAFYPPHSVSARRQADRQHLVRSHFVGTPDEVVEQILFHHELFGHQRVLLNIGRQILDHTRRLHAIELFGTRVAPLVRAELARWRSSQT